MRWLPCSQWPPVFGSYCWQVAQERQWLQVGGALALGSSLSPAAWLLYDFGQVVQLLSLTFPFYKIVLPASQGALRAHGFIRVQPLALSRWQPLLP